MKVLRISWSARFTFTLRSVIPLVLFAYPPKAPVLFTRVRIEKYPNFVQGFDRLHYTFLLDVDVAISPVDA